MDQDIGPQSPSKVLVGVAYRVNEKALFVRAAQFGHGKSGSEHLKGFSDWIGAGLERDKCRID